MKTTLRFLSFLGVLTISAGLTSSPAPAVAQVPVYSTDRVYTPVAPLVTTSPTYSYGVPTRRALRNQRRTALRPNYVGGRSPLSFAPYTDRYATRSLTPGPTYTLVTPR